MITFSVTSCKDIEQKRFDIVVQSFVIQKQFRQQAKILTVDFIRISINFKYGNFATSINFSSRWISPCAFVQVAIENELALGVFQAELAKKEFRQSKMIFFVNLNCFNKKVEDFTVHIPEEMDSNTKSQSHVFRIQSLLDIFPARLTATILDSALTVNSLDLVW
jgi:ABC-type multidrug transport system permease subunit